MKRLVRRLIIGLSIVVMQATPLAILAERAQAASNDTYSIAWKLSFSHSGKDSFAGVAPSGANDGQDAYNIELTESASYEGNGKLQVSSTGTTISSLQTTAHSSLHSVNSWSHYPGWQCQGDPGSADYSQQIKSQTTERTVNTANPNEHLNDAHPPSFITLKPSQASDGSYSMPYPLGNDPRTWQLAGSDDVTTDHCGTDATHTNTPWSYPREGDADWRINDGTPTPTDLHANLTSSDGGNTYSLHTTKTKMIGVYSLVYKADITVKRLTEQPFHITAPTNNAQLNKHMKSVAPETDVNFAWQPLSDAKKYTVDLLDQNTHQYKLQNHDMGVRTAFTRSNQDFTWGHEYEFKVTALTQDGQQHADTVHFKVKVLPTMDDPLALRIEATNAVIWENTSASLRTARDKFAKILNDHHLTISYSSAYRPLQYQEHLFLIVHNLQDPHLSNDDKIFLQKEKKHHGLGTQVARPDANAPHTRGIAFDATIRDQRGTALNSHGSINSGVLAFARSVGFQNPPRNDNVHFQVAQ